MLSFLYKILIGNCFWHKWKIIRETDLYWKNGENGELPIGLQYHLQCEKCGEVVKRRR